MRSLAKRQILALGLLIVATIIVKGCAGSERLAVVVRPCVLEGSNLASMENAIGRVQVTNGGLRRMNDMIEAASQIWVRGAGIALLIPPHGPRAEIPIIADPVPPGASDEVKMSSAVDSGQLGDVFQEQGSDTTSESQRVVDECNRVWDEAFPDGRPGLPIIFVGRFVKLNGFRDVSLLGFGPPIEASPEVCDRPYRLSAALVANRFIMMPTNIPLDEQNVAKHTLAHEFGHALLLRHGDGIDNNSDGRWDFGCDGSGEAFSDGSELRSLMLAMDQSNETITPLQRDFARMVATQYSGTLGGPP